MAVKVYLNDKTFIPFNCSKDSIEYKRYMLEWMAAIKDGYKLKESIENSIVSCRGFTGGILDVEEFVLGEYMDGNKTVEYRLTIIDRENRATITLDGVQPNEIEFID